MRWVVSTTMAAVLAAASVSPAMAAKHAKPAKTMSGACAPAERPLHFRLRSIELVHDVHLRERPIDPGTVLALLPAEWFMPGAALLRNQTGWVRP